MARQPVGRDGSADEFQSLATNLSAQLDADRADVLRTVRRLSDELPSLRSQHDANSISGALQYIGQCVLSAFESLGSSAALALLDETPAKLLEDRIWVSHYLSGANGNVLPLFTREQLADKLAAFCIFLDKNRPHLLETGLPQSKFPRCHWLWANLAKLYPVQRADNEQPFDEPIVCEGVDSYYKWWRGFGVMRIPCRQVDANRITGLTANDAERSVEIRQKLLQLKVDVLKDCEEYLRTADSGDLWTKCWPRFLKAMTAVEANFCTRMDQIYAEVPDRLKDMDVTISWRYGYERPLDPGGLGAIFELIGHVEKERSIGTLHTTREVLGDLVIDDSGGPVLWESDSWPYFALVSEVGQTLLDPAINIFLRRDEQEGAFWHNFRHRASTSLRQWDQEITINLRAKPDMAEPIRLHVQTYAEFVISRLQLGGGLPSLALTSPSVRPAADDAKPNIFQRNRDTWRVRFKSGKEFFPRHSDGMLYLRELLRKPKTGFSAKQLYAVKIEFERPSPSRSVAIMATQQCSIDGASPSISVGETDDGDVIDKTAIEDYKKELLEIENNLKKANLNNDLAKIERLQKEKAFLESEIQAGTGLGGRPAKISPSNKKTVDKVKNAINRAIQKFAANDGAPPTPYQLHWL